MILGDTNGYAYGDSDPAKVLTTAAGAGSYVPPIASQVQNQANGGTPYGASGNYGTLAQPSAQLTTDQAAVSAKKAYIYPNANLLTKNDGTLRASNIGTLAGTANLTPALVALGTTIDDVVGESTDTTSDNAAVAAAAEANRPIFRIG